MQSDNDPCGPLYIYNGPANLQELERVNLTGARIFFNGSYSLRDLRNVNFLGATVFMNGQEKFPPPPLRSRSRSRSPPRPASPERRHSDYYRPYDDFYRPGEEHRGSGPRGIRGRQDRKRRRADDSSEVDSTGSYLEPDLSAAVQPFATRIPDHRIKYEPGRLSPYEDEDTKYTGKSIMISPGGGHPLLTERISQTERHQQQSAAAGRSMNESERVTYETSTDGPLETGRLFSKGSSGSSAASPRQTAKRMRIESASASGLSEKANSLATEELNLRLKKRVLTNLGKSSQKENAKIKQISAERLRIKSELLQQPGREDPSAASLPVPPQVQQATLLPQESPLKNIITFAKVEEEIVQLKIRYAMAEKQLRRERQTVGRASTAIIRDVKAIGRGLAELYEQRDETQADRRRIDAFRRPTNKKEPASPVSVPISAPILNPVASNSIPASDDEEIRDKRPARQQTPTDMTDAVQNNVAIPDTAS